MPGDGLYGPEVEDDVIVIEVGHTAENMDIAWDALKAAGITIKVADFIAGTITLAATQENIAKIPDIKQMKGISTCEVMSEREAREVIAP